MKLLPMLSLIFFVPISLFGSPIESLSQLKDPNTREQLAQHIHSITQALQQTQARYDIRQLTQEGKRILDGCQQLQRPLQRRLIQWQTKIDNEELEQFDTACETLKKTLTEHVLQDKF